MRYFSMFSGVGGFELGIEYAYKRTKPKPQERPQGRVGTVDEPSLPVRTGNQPPLCIGYSEIDRYAIKVYERQLNGHRNYGDATTINPADLPDFDLLVGGFPCQSFSIAGKRRGFDDTRGTLFFDIARILKDKRPGHLLLENVKGLLSHDGGKTFQTMLRVLADLGYRVEWQVLNSKDFGVPQNRERIFIVGHLRGECGRQVFPIGGTDGKDIIVSGVLDTPTWQKRHEQIRRIHHPDGISPTLPTGTGGGVMTKVDLRPKVRRLTPRECERLQGFPDDWTKFGSQGGGGDELNTSLSPQAIKEGQNPAPPIPISDTQRYKMMGNAVTVNTVQAVMNKLRECL